MNAHLTNIGTPLFEKLRAIKNDSSGNVKMTDVEALIKSVIEIFEEQMHKEEELVRKEISSVIQHFSDLHNDISNVPGGVVSREKIMDANQNLDQVVKATEDATNTILDNVDSIQKVAESLPAEQADAIKSATTNIYQACNFQDLTGQRIKNVLKVMAAVEDRMNALASLLGIADEDEISYEQSLMNGPQNNDAPSQDDIDKLFGD